jgi:hypothetical protein
MRRIELRAVVVLMLLAWPGVARADAVDSLGVVASAGILVWALVALPALALACFSEPPSAGARMFLSAFLCVAWGPGILFGLAADAPVISLVFAAIVAGGLVRVWRDIPPEIGA